MDRPVILIVDDEKNIIKLLIRNLMDDNYQILTAESGKQGLEILKDRDVDLIISDYSMPEMTDLEFLNQVKIKYPHIQTIMLTARNDIETARNAVDKAGIFKFFLKPWNEAELRFCIKQALDVRNMRLERDTMLQKIKARSILYDDLEAKHPGITRTIDDEYHDENQYTILLVDDERLVLKALIRAFIDTEYNILTARSAIDGLELLRENTIDLIISDYDMPGINGMEFLKTVRKIYPDVLTIILTAYADVDLLIEGINSAGIYRYILKPWNDEELVLSVKRAMEFRRLDMEKRILIDYK